MKIKVLVALVACLSLSIVRLAFAESLEVAPISIRVPQTGGAAEVYLTNRSHDITAVQIEGFLWTQTDGREQLVPSSEIQISPPFAEIDPGKEQLVRILVGAGQDSYKERSYRILISQIPTVQQRVDERIQVLLQFSIPVFAGARNPQPPELSWSLERNSNLFKVSATNLSERHAKLTEIRLLSRNGEESTLLHKRLSYILPDTTKAWTIEASRVSLLDPSWVEVTYDNGISRREELSTN